MFDDMKKIVDFMNLQNERIVKLEGVREYLKSSNHELEHKYFIQGLRLKGEIADVLHTCVPKLEDDIFARYIDDYVIPYIYRGDNSKCLKEFEKWKSEVTKWL